MKTVSCRQTSASCPVSAVSVLAILATGGASVALHSWKQRPSRTEISSIHHGLDSGLAGPVDGAVNEFLMETSPTVSHPSHAASSPRGDLPAFSQSLHILDACLDKL